MSMTRRDVLQSLPVASASLLTAFSALAAAENASAQSRDLGVLPSNAWTFEELKVTKSPEGAEFRPILMGKLATGEILEVHETMLPPGECRIRLTITCIPKCGSCAKAQSNSTSWARRRTSALA